MIEMAGSSPATTMKLSRVAVAMAVVPARLGDRRTAHAVERVFKALRRQPAGRHIALRDAGETAIVIGRQFDAAIEAQADRIVDLGARRRRGECERDGHTGHAREGDTITFG